MPRKPVQKPKKPKKDQRPSILKCCVGCGRDTTDALGYCSRCIGVNHISPVEHWVGQRAEMRERARKGRASYHGNIRDDV